MMVLDWALDLTLTFSSVNSSDSTEFRSFEGPRYHDLNMSTSILANS
jgi:hypothetical protein